MLNIKKVIVPAVTALALVGFIGTDVAFAQTAAGEADATHLTKRYNSTRRPLTVRRAPVAAPVAAAVAAPVAAVTAVTAPVAGIVSPVTGAASTIVGLPFQALGSVFPAGGPRAGGVTPVRYAGAGAEAAKIDEGWAQPVPVDKSGPIYVVANGDPTVSPMSIIGAPIAVAGQIVQTPFKIIGATGL